MPMTLTHQNTHTHARAHSTTHCGRTVDAQRKRRVFRDPQAMIVKEGARIMSLLDGTSKVGILGCAVCLFWLVLCWFVLVLFV